MSEEHIPIPEGWLDPQFRGGSGPEFDPVSMAYPVLVPPGGPGVGPGMKPAGVAGMVHAGEMAAPIPAPVTTPAGGIAVGTGRGSSLYRRPAGSSPDGPLVRVGEARHTDPGTRLDAPDWSPEVDSERADSGGSVGIETAHLVAGSTMGYAVHDPPPMAPRGAPSLCRSRRDPSEQSPVGPEFSIRTVQACHA